MPFSTQGVVITGRRSVQCIFAVGSLQPWPLTGPAGPQWGATDLTHVSVYLQSWHIIAAMVRSGEQEPHAGREETFPEIIAGHQPPLTPCMCPCVPCGYCALFAQYTSVGRPIPMYFLLEGCSHANFLGNTVIHQPSLTHLEFLYYLFSPINKMPTFS